MDVSFFYFQKSNSTLSLKHFYPIFYSKFFVQIEVMYYLYKFTSINEVYYLLLKILNWKSIRLKSFHHIIQLISVSLLRNLLIK